MSEVITSQRRQGRLFLIPTPLDFGCEVTLDIAQVLPQSSLHAASQITHWVTENAKSTRAFLKRVQTQYELAAPLQQMHIIELPREVHKKGDHHPQAFDAKPLLAPALQGHDIALVSEAGMPAIADPGSSVVRCAHDLGLEVIPLIGPISLMLALAASGLNGQNFAFVGYLPQEANERIKRIKTLEALALQSGQSQLFIETPYRNAALWDALIKHLQPSTRLVRASGLTLPEMQIDSQRVDQWRKQTTPISGSPTVFALGK